MRIVKLEVYFRRLRCAYPWFLSHFQRKKPSFLLLWLKFATDPFFQPDQRRQLWKFPLYVGKAPQIKLRKKRNSKPLSLLEVVLHCIPTAWPSHCVFYFIDPEIIIPVSVLRPHDPQRHNCHRRIFVYRRLCSFLVSRNTVYCTFDGQFWHQASEWFFR